MAVTVHAGEWGGPENVREAIERFNATRIGHGVREIGDAMAQQAGRIAYVSGAAFTNEGVEALEGRILMVNKLSLGGIYDFYRTDHVKFGIGGLVSKYALPDALKPLYGGDPTSGMLFLRLKVI